MQVKKEVASKMNVRPTMSVSVPQHERTVEVSQVRKRKPLIPNFEMLSEEYLKCLKGSSMYNSQFSSVAQSCLTLCNPMDCSMPGLPVHHQLPKFTQTHLH